VERKCPLKHPWAWTLLALLMVGCAAYCARRPMRARRGRELDGSEVPEPIPA
jgi:hypothetical protein